MIYQFKLPRIVPQMGGATIECLYARPGDILKMGSKLLDLSVDLSSAFSQDCPPISFFRVVLRETVVLRAIDAAPGTYFSVDDEIALFSTEATEDIKVNPSRSVRMIVAGIVHHEAMWTGRMA
jgi:hypothetical protein